MLRDLLQEYKLTVFCAAFLFVVQMQSPSYAFWVLSGTMQKQLFNLFAIIALSFSYIESYIQDLQISLTGLGKLKIPYNCTLLSALFVFKANQELEMLEKEMLLMQASAKLFEVAIADKEVRLLKKVQDISTYIDVRFFFFK